MSFNHQKHHQNAFQGIWMLFILKEETLSILLHPKFLIPDLPVKICGGIGGENDQNMTFGGTLDQILGINCPVSGKRLI